MMPGISFASGGDHVSEMLMSGVLVLHEGCPSTQTQSHHTFF